jgi:hypothetical protein
MHCLFETIENEVEGISPKQAKDSLTGFVATPRDNLF